jgi:hypothetical protein
MGRISCFNSDIRPIFLPLSGAPVFMRNFRLIVSAIILAVLTSPLPSRAGELVSVRISSEPEGARIYVDGAFRGETPASLQIPSGKRELFLYRAGFLPIKRQVSWQPQERPILRETLRPQKGGIVILTDPPAAEAYLGGRFLGNTPLAFERMPIGKHTLELRAPGFHTLSREIVLDENDPNVVDVRLDGPPVFVWVEAETGSRVFLNGAYTGEVTRESLGLRIRPGTHELRIEKAGFASVQTIRLEPGRDVVLAAGRMQRIPGVVRQETPRLDKRWFAVAGSAGLTLTGLVVGTIGLVDAHMARDDYANAWRTAEIDAARDEVVSGNRRFLLGTSLAALGTAGMYFSWPAPTSTDVAFSGDRILFTWRMAP